MCALPPKEAQRYENLCVTAVAQVEGERNGAPGGLEALADYAAALAARRFVLRCISTGSVVSIGEPGVSRGGALAAAEALERDYRRIASRWLRSRDFCFWQVPRPVEEEAPLEPEEPGEPLEPSGPEIPDVPGEVEE